MEKAGEAKEQNPMLKPKFPGSDGTVPFNLSVSVLNIPETQGIFDKGLGGVSIHRTNSFEIGDGTKQEGGLKESKGTEVGNSLFKTSLQPKEGPPKTAFSFGNQLTKPAEKKVLKEGGLSFESPKKEEKKEKPGLLDTKEEGSKVMKKGSKDLSEDKNKVKVEGPEKIVKKSFKQSEGNALQSQLFKDYPVGIDNYSIIQAIKRLEPLAPRETQKLILNYLFYAKDRNLTAEFEKVKKQDQTLGIKMLKNSPDKKVLSKLIHRIIEEIASCLKINPVAALDLLELYLKDNHKEFTTPKLVETLKHTGVIKEKAEDSYDIVVEKPFVQKILSQVSVILKQQLKQIPLAFSRATKLNYKIFNSEHEARKCCENLWDSFRYYHHISPSEHQLKLVSILEAFSSLISAHKLTINPTMICSILELLDAALIKKEVPKDTALSFILKLLRLDVVNLLLKGVNVDGINVFDTRGKEVRNCLLSLESIELFPLKVILPQIDETLTSKERCLSLDDADFSVDGFGTKKEHALNAPYWLDWLEIWIEGMKNRRSINEAHLLTALECLRNCLRVEHSTFWLHEFSPRFENSKWLLNQSINQNYLKQTFQILEATAGNQKTSYTDLAYNLALSVVEPDLFVTLMKKASSPKPIEPDSESCLNFICKIAHISPEIETRIEKEIFGYDGPLGVLVIYFMEILSQLDNRERILFRIIQVFNSLFEHNPQKFLTQIRQFERKYESSYTLQMFQNTRTMIQNKPLFQALCEHLNLLISYPESLTILGENSQWLNKFKTFQPWRVKNSDSIKCIKFLLISQNNDNSFWGSSLRRVDLNNIFDSIINHRYEKHNKKEVFVNEIIYNFLTNPGDENCVSDLKLLSETLALLQTGITLLEKSKMRKGKNDSGIIPLLSNIFHLFVFNINPSSSVDDNWFDARKPIHPYLIFIQMFNLSQEDVELIHSKTKKNIAQIAINILSRIMKMNFLENNDREENLLFKLLTKPVEVEQENNPSEKNLAASSLGDKNLFVESLRLKIESRFIVENIIQLLVYMSYSDKILLTYIIEKLKKEFLHIFIWGLSSENMILKTRIHILLLKLIDRTNKNSSFLKLAFTNPNFWLVLTTHQPISMGFKDKTFQKEIEKTAEGSNEGAMRYFHQTLLRFALISNSTEIFLTMIKDYNITDFEAYRLSFFQIFHSENIQLLFRNQRNFQESILIKEGDWFKFVPSHVSQELNDFILNFQSYSDSPKSVIKTIVRANTLAYNNLFKIYMSVINLTRTLTISRHILDSNQNQHKVIQLLINFLTYLNDGKNNYPIYLLQMMGTAIRIADRNSGFLISSLLRDTRWFKLRNSQENKKIFFLLQSIVDTGIINKQLDNMVRLMLENTKSISSDRIILAKSSKVSLHKQAIEQLPLLVHDARSFGLCCEYLVSEYSTRALPPSALLIKSLCEIISNFSDPIQQISFYKDQQRNRDHLIWCWCLVLAKTTNVYDYGDYIAAFHHVVVRRVKRIIAEINTSPNRIITRGFKEEIEFITEYISSLMIANSPYAAESVETVYKLWTQFVTVTISLKTHPITDLEKSMATTFSVDRAGGLFSARSVSPHTPRATVYRKQSQQSNHIPSPMTGSTSKQKQFEATPLELLNEISTYNIVYNMLGFLKRNYQSLDLDKATSRHQFQDNLTKTLYRILEFYQQSYGVVSIGDVFKALNSVLSSQESSKQTGKLSDLSQKLNIESLSESAHRIIHVIVELYSIHLNHLGQIRQKFNISHELREYFQKMERASKKLSEFKALVEDSMVLENNLTLSDTYKFRFTRKIMASEKDTQAYNREMRQRKREGL